MRSASVALAVLAIGAGCTIEVDPALTAPAVTTADTTVTWSKSVASSGTVTIQNANGPVDVGVSSDGLVHVTAVERLNGSPAVTIRFEETAQGVTVCSLYDSDSRCADGSRSNGSRAVVEFTVLVPSGQRLNLVTGNGTITTAPGASPQNATTGNGDIVTIMSGTSARDDVTLTTGNGSIRVTVPAGYNARIQATTGNGTVQSAVPITIEGVFDGHSLRGTLGNGGALIKLTTGNGQLELKQG